MDKDLPLYKYSGIIVLLCLFFLCLTTPSDGTEKGKDGDIIAKKQLRDQVKAVTEATKQEVIRQGAKVEFSVDPLYVPKLMEGEVVEVSFEITDETGEPITGLYPGVWIDIRGKSLLEDAETNLTCDDKIRVFLKGLLSYRPAIDLNSYFILSLNNDATVSVFDPILGFKNITQLYTMIYLKERGEDWVSDEEEDFIFITMPKADQVAVADTDTFKVVKDLRVGNNPVRIALQPDSRYLWVGIDERRKEKGGVTVIDVEKQAVVGSIQTGFGHHEIAFSDDSLFAFVTNSEDGNVTVIDIQKLEKIKDVDVGKNPVSISFSGLSKSIYVANEGEGDIVAIDGRTHKIVKRITANNGLKQLRFAPGDRWGFVSNPVENLVYIFDASNDSIVYTIDGVGEEPDKISFSEEFAYIRSKKDVRFSMVELVTLGKVEKPVILRVPIGQRPPGDSQFDSVADAITESSQEGHILVTNPADSVIYYYMEGMNVSMGSFRNVGGHVPRAVRVVDRTVKETEKGVYTSTIRIPVKGEYDVAFLLDSPRIVHCFDFMAEHNPVLGKKEKVPTIELVNADKKMNVGKEFIIKFKLFYSDTEELIKTVTDLSVQAIHSSGMPSTYHKVTHVGEGIYEAVLDVPKKGFYYVNFNSSSLNMNPREFPNLVFQAMAGKDIKD
jgi:YVTN family beta-propeller protein